MRAITIDKDGTLRCWNCGATDFAHKRTGRSKVAFGVFALASSKKLKCLVCGSYNLPGKAETFTGPADPTYRRRWHRDRAAGNPASPAEAEMTARARGEYDQENDSDATNVQLVDEDVLPRIAPPPAHLLDEPARPDE